MANLDVSKNWIILADIPLREAAAELALYIGLLRGKAGIGQEQPRIAEAAAVSHNPGPCIIIKAAAGNQGQNGFSWKFGKDRIEICGDSPRGLWNGIFDFLAALGIKWPAPDQEELPQAGAGSNNTAFSLKTDKAVFYSISSARDRRRLFIDEKTGAKEREKLVIWAARNKYDALVFSLKEKSLWARVRAKAQRGSRVYGADRYALALEAGGRDLSLLLPQRLFLFHRNLFRMESGKRKADSHFCTTNPETISRIKKQVRKLFNRALPGMTAPRVFHLLPDQGHENTWCACPACRAFSPAEQYIIAVNSAADALASIDLRALLSFLDFGIAAGEPGAGGIAARKNMFPSQ
jgi:hypothetical protein